MIGWDARSGQNIFAKRGAEHLLSQRLGNATKLSEEQNGNQGPAVFRDLGTVYMARQDGADRSKSSVQMTAPGYLPDLRLDYTRPSKFLSYTFSRMSLAILFPI